MPYVVHSQHVTDRIGLCSDAVHLYLASLTDHSIRDRIDMQP